MDQQAKLKQGKELRFHHELQAFQQRIELLELQEFQLMMLKEQSKRHYQEET